jgi:hypothetical protein
MAHISDIILYPASNYLHYDDTDNTRGYVHGYHVDQAHTIALLRRYGAKEISVIVHENNRDIPALKRVQEWSAAGYTHLPTPIEGPLTWRLQRIPSHAEGPA